MAIIQQRSIYAVLAPPENRKVEHALNHRITKGDALVIGPGQYLVAFGGTTRELSDALGVTDAISAPGPVGPAVIFKVSDFYGSAASELWEWLSSQMRSAVPA